MQTQDFEWPTLQALLKQNGVRSAAWATLRWVELLFGPDLPGEIDPMLLELRPGWLRRAWLDRWLRLDLSERLSSAHWPRLMAFSPLLHDTPRDVLRAIRGRRQAHRSRHADLAAFQELLSQ
jgi:hypothetical protein